MTRRLSDAQRRKVLKAYNAGHLSLQEVADKFNVSTSSISKWARAAGLPRRAKGPGPDPNSKRQRAKAAALAEDASPKTLDPDQGTWVRDRHGIARWVAVTTKGTP